ncbi:complexin-3-like isoform X1 [Numida meleagris]|uniref:complexin-3-like isoform X1 n=1 Tax=Numida meleagris TaxID=8996 RepID=UPI000B3E386B|nr:complexin-3-like isoform X1 [Numida meleagris]
MAAFFTAALRNLRGGEEEPKAPPKDGKAAALPQGMSREEFEEYQRQLLEEKIERDKAFAHKKAERATVRMHLRDKYHLAQVRTHRGAPSPPPSIPPSWVAAILLLPGPKGWEAIPEEGSRWLLSPSVPSAHARVCPAVPVWGWAAAGTPGRPIPRARSSRSLPRMVGVHLQPQCHLPPTQDERDDAQLHVAGGAVELPQELAAMVRGEEEEEEEEEQGAFAFLTKLRDMDLPALRGRALGTVDEVKEKCSLM